LLNLTGFFSSAGGFAGGGVPGPETPAMVAVVDIISGSAVVIRGPDQGKRLLLRKEWRRGCEERRRGATAEDAQLLSKSFGGWS
jgi:hypothetical protein